MIKFEYRLTLNDFKDFNQVHAKPILLQLFLLYAGVFIFIALINSLPKWNMSFQGFLLDVVLPNLSIAAITCAAIYILQQFSIKRAWNNLHAIKNETVVEVNDEELTIITPLSISILKWAIYTSWKETANLFLVYQSHTCSSIFPKRAFISDGQINEFRELLISKLPNK